jgi:glycosyltransferase involved in cell wall biosynthesis
LGQSQILPYLIGLSKQGYEFTILSFEKKDRFRIGKDNISELVATANISWNPLSFSTRPPVLAKIYDLWQMKQTAVRLHRENKFDLIHCRSYVAAQAGMKLKKKFGVPFLFDMRGFWADEKKEAGRWPDLIYKRYKKLEKQLLKEADAVVSLTQAAKKEMISWNVDDNLANKTCVIPCCADLSLFHFSEEQNATVLEHEVKGHFPIINYLGSLGPAYGMKEMLQFFSLVKERFPTARFFFYTKDDSRLVLEHAKEFQNISPKDLLFQFVQRKELPSFLSVVDYSLFFYQPAYSRLACSPTKFAELAGMGIPVICNEVGDLNKEFLVNTPHKVLHDLSEESMRKVIDDMHEKNGKDKHAIRAFAVEKYSLDNGILAYAAIYKSLIK